MEGLKIKMQDYEDSGGEGKKHTLDGRVSDVGHGDGVVGTSKTRRRGDEGREGWREERGRERRGKAETSQVGGNEEIHEILIHDSRKFAVFRITPVPPALGLGFFSFSFSFLFC